MKPLPPRIEFMMGPKSAPAFERAPSRQPQTAPRQVLPGSKSHAVIDPPTFTPGSTGPHAAPPPNAKPPSQTQQQGQLVQPAPQRDLLFGTYRCPDHEPEKIGIREKISPTYIGQLLHPFGIVLAGQKPQPAVEE